MELWMLFVIISIVSILIEIFAPSLFCINFAFAGIITAIVAIFWGNLYSLLLIFLVLSLLSILFIKPLLTKLLKKDTHADFDSQYLGKIVKSIEPITSTKGAVTIYDERWEARVKNENEEIPAGCDVRIIGNDSLILFVEKV